MATPLDIQELHTILSEYFIPTQFPQVNFSINRQVSLAEPSVFMWTTHSRRHFRVRNGILYRVAFKVPNSPRLDFWVCLLTTGRSATLFFNMEENGCSFNFPYRLHGSSYILLSPLFHYLEIKPGKYFPLIFFRCCHSEIVYISRVNLFFFFSTFVFMGTWILFIYGSRVMGVIGLVYLYLLKESVFKIDTCKFKYYFVSLPFTWLTFLLFWTNIFFPVGVEEVTQNRVSRTEEQPLLLVFFSGTKKRKEKAWKIGERNSSCNYIVAKRNVSLFIMQWKTIVTKVFLRQK